MLMLTVSLAVYFRCGFNCEQDFCVFSSATTFAKNIFALRSLPTAEQNGIGEQATSCANKEVEKVCDCGAPG